MKTAPEETAYSSKCYTRRTFAEINLLSLINNLRVLEKNLPEKCGIIAVVKANAYGHGDTHIADALERNGVGYFAVSGIDEALALRKYGIKSDILVLGYTPPDFCLLLSENNITQTVFSLKYAYELNLAALEKGIELNIHIKLDTGMGRIGFECIGNENVRCEIEKIFSFSGLKVMGMFTHLAYADSLENGALKYTGGQMRIFNEIDEYLRNKGLETGLLHIQNSAGVINHKNMKYDLVRCGISLYGLYPSGDCNKAEGLCPVLSLKSEIVMLKTLPPSSHVSYGCTYTSDKTVKIATVPIGYADGYPRALSGIGEAIVRGVRVKIAGRICMDYLMLDVTDVEGASEGDIVTLIGRDGREEITVDELAALAGTIGYELLCGIGQRVSRIYVE